MDFGAFIRQLSESSDYQGQIAYVRETAAREARYSDEPFPMCEESLRVLKAQGIEKLYTHQAEAIRKVLDGKDVAIVTGTASGKTLCYQLPIVHLLRTDPQSTVLLLFPTKALCQDQYAGFLRVLEAAGMSDIPAGVYDGDTSTAMRRKLRDHGRVLFTNPDMLHAAVTPQHGRWARFFMNLRLIVIDEMHVYNGIFGTGMVQLLRRLKRICAHYQREPRMLLCSATIGNPKQLAEQLTQREIHLIDDDGSPRGTRHYVFWNPPRLRATRWRSRKSANVEAHELMSALVMNRIPTITFSKAKMTAELIHRYVTEKLQAEAPQLAGSITPYRGGYRPEERREIERRLFSGELLGVSTTNALELGINIGGLDSSIIVGYPGTLASFFQQAGRAGRSSHESLVVLIGLDTAVNQYVMSNPAYIFERPLEQSVLDPDNPFVIMGHLRCAASELPLHDNELPVFGIYAGLVLEVLERNGKVRYIDGKWYHSSSEIPHHEVTLRDYASQNVIIEDSETKEAIGELNKYDAPPILHPEAIYMHRGETYRVLSLDLQRNIAQVKKEATDYYTQPVGGTDVHHIDNTLREKSIGSGRAYWGEVTAYFRTFAYDKVKFYTLDSISRHGVDLPTLVLETMAFWIVPPEDLMEKVRKAGLDAHNGLRAVGYATRMLLPLFMTCDTLSFSHSIGSANSAWNAIFIYERYPLGLGFTERAYDRLHQIMPAVLDIIRKCPCRDGCPCCVGKPLRQSTVWNVERGEGSIPSKAAARMILEGLIGDGSSLTALDTTQTTGSKESERLKLDMAVRRRLERMREPAVFHMIDQKVETEYPDPEPVEKLPVADSSRRSERRREFEKKLRKISGSKEYKDPQDVSHVKAPPGMVTGHGVVGPDEFPGKPVRKYDFENLKTPSAGKKNTDSTEPKKSIIAGDSLASLARRKVKEKKKAE